MKKWLILLCLLTTLSLAACAGTGNGGTGGTQSPSPVPSTEDLPSGGETDETAQAPVPLLASFSTTDLEGNAVDQSILEGYDLTLVNVWATYCTPCLNEMPDLGTLAADYEEKGVQVLGLVSDVLNSDGSIDDGQVELAQEIVAETGADYRHLLPSADLYGLLGQIYAVPTTFFVDSEGTQVGYAYVTAMSYDQFAEVIDAALAEAAS